MLLPGLVDTHVHVNEPGRTEWEGFATATAAAAAGGVTTILDMPLNSIPPTVVADGAGGEAGGGAGPGARRRRLLGRRGPRQPRRRCGPLHEAGAYGVKCFLLDSGVPEFPPLDPAGLRAALTELAAFDGLLIAHCEDPATIRPLRPAGTTPASWPPGRRRPRPARWPG